MREEGKGAKEKGERLRGWGGIEEGKHEWLILCQDSYFVYNAMHPSI